MNSGARTTMILLDRGVEDVSLLRELLSITAATGISGVKEFAEKYPHILELKQGLQDEVASQAEGD